MNVFHKVTLESLKKNRVRTIVTIVGIILSAAMICAVTTFASSFYNYIGEYYKYVYGDWHGSAERVEWNTYTNLWGTGDIEEATYNQILGYADINSENEFKPYLYIIGGESEDFVERMPVHLLSGRYPKDSTEIILPKHLETNGNVKYKQGDTLTLEIGERMLDGYSMSQNNPCYMQDENGEDVFNGESLQIKETRTYTVVGFYERLHFMLEEYSAPGYTAITVADKERTGEVLYDVYFKMEKPKEIYNFVKEHHIEGQINSDVLMFQGVLVYNNFGVMIGSLTAIVIALIMFGSISLIYNAFSISVSERTKQFGLLSSVGATKKQLRKMVIYEAFVVSSIGIPLGVLSGITGIGITLKVIGDKFKAFGFPMDMKLSASVISIVIAVIVALVTVLLSAWIPSKRAMRVSAVEAIRQNMDIHAKSRLIIMIIVSVLTICLIIWRFWPQSFTKATSVDKNSIVRVSVHAMFNEFENGQTNIDTYRIDDMDQQMNTLEEIMEILATSSYRQDFRNLLLWDLDYVDADKNYDGRTVTVSFYMNNQMDKYVQIQFLSSSIIVVSSGGETGFRVYHPTNHQTIDQLSEYIQTHGVKE